MSLILKFLKIFVFLLPMQTLRHSGCWGDNSTPPPPLYFLLDNNENYAFISIVSTFFCRFVPWLWKLKEKN